MGSPWQPPGTQAPQGNWQPGASISPPNHAPVTPPHQPRRWGLVITVVVVNVIAVAATAAITYMLSNHDSPPVSSTLSSPPPAKTYSTAEQSAAKDKVCHTFDTSGERGTVGEGGVVVNGDLNVPVILRKMNSVLSVQNSLMSAPATPSEVVSAANNYIDTATALTTAALAKAPFDDLVALTKTGNAAMVGFADVCGLPH